MGVHVATARTNLTQRYFIFQCKVFFVSTPFLMLDVLLYTQGMAACMNYIRQFAIISWMIFLFTLLPVSVHYIGYKSSIVNTEGNNDFEETTVSQAGAGGPGSLTVSTGSGEESHGDSELPAHSPA